MSSRATSADVIALKATPEAPLSGWYTQLSSDKTVFYGALQVAKKTHKSLREPLDGLVLYIPNSGTTIARTKQNTKEYVCLCPGAAYFYSASTGEYQAEFNEPGEYSGIKIFFNPHTQLNLGVYRQYIANPSRPLFVQVPLPHELMQEICSLPTTPPHHAHDNHTLRHNIIQIINTVIAIFYTHERLSKNRRPTCTLSQIIAASEYLKKHIETAPSVQTLANLVGANHMTLKRHYRQHFGTTIYGHLRALRMTKARELLSQDVTVTDTSLRVGYANPSKFAAAFKREVGLTPTQYKAQRKHHLL